MIATATTVVSAASWLLLGSPFGQRHFPALAAAVPDHFWVSTFANLLLFGVAYGASLLIGNRRDVDLTGLTIWRSQHDHSADR